MTNLIAEGDLHLFAAAYFCCVLVAAAAATLRRAPRRDLVYLAAIVALGLGLRLALARHQLMGVSDYKRDVPWLWWAMKYGLPVLAPFRDGLTRFDVISRYNLFFSATLPVLLYTQARLGFSQRRLPLLVALVFAISPIPIGFAASNVEFISSMVFSTAMLIMLHQLLLTDDWLAGVVSFFGLLVSFLFTVDTRPENICFFVIIPVAFYAHTLRGAPGKSWKLVALLAVEVVGVGYVIRVATSGTSTIAPGTGVSSTAELIRTGLRDLGPHLVDSNNYFKPTMQPLCLTVLVVIGAVRLLLTDHRRFLYLLTWFGSIYLTHGLIQGENFLNASRYALHSYIPVTFAAAYGLDVLIEGFRRRERIRFLDALPAGRWAVAAVALAVAVWTAPPGLQIVRLPDDDVEEEYHFLSELWSRGVVEPGAMVVESYGDPHTTRYSSESRRFAVLGRRTRAGSMVTVVASVPELEAHDGPIYLFEGLPCFWDREAGHEVGAYCERGRASGNWELVAGHTIEGAVHNLAAGEDTLGSTIALYRLKGVPPTPTRARTPSSRSKK